MSKKLTGKVALVTGGSRGIGAAAARALADAGAHVAISYASSAEKAESVVRDLERRDVGAVAYRADQADPAQVEAVVKAVIERFGRLDILVNNAGVAVYAAVGDPAADLAAIERHWAINVHGVAATVRAAAAVMSDGGRIISVSSTAAHHMPFTGLSDYSAGKAAIIGYTKGWARDLGARKITVNTVNPGPIDTDMNPASGPYGDYVKTALALGRYGTPEEAAAAIVFLASPEASFITGASLDVDGGLSA
jgi:3-oxoacyl-[acyl-carrier protein] reductase